MEQEKFIMEKIVELVEQKNHLVEQLESLNIHGGAVYPDLTHMSTYIKHKYLKDGLTIPIRKKAEASKPGKTKSTKKITKPSSSIKKEDFVKPFDFDKIKEVDRNTQLEEFSKFYNLDSKKLEKIVDDINFTEKPPLRDEVTNAMNAKPPLKTRVKILNSLIEKIITLSKLISENKE
jgi:hypothetical protein